MRLCKYILALIILSSCCLPLLAQPADYLVLTSGDTLYGQVQFLAPPASDRVYLKKISLITSKQKTKFRLKEISAIHSNSTTYRLFRLENKVALPNPFREYFHLNGNEGQLYVLKLIQQGQLSHYEWQWKEQGESTLTSTDLFIKSNDDYFIRATQGLLGLKRKALADYFTDCPELVRLLQEKQLNTPAQVVNFYNRQCSSLPN